MNSILTESVYKLYEQIQKFFYINQNNSSDTNKNIIDKNIIDENIKKEHQRKKNEHFIFVDTTTTGLIPKKNKQYIHPRNKEAYDDTRLISLSYMITDGNGETIKEPKHFYIKPYDFEMCYEIEQLTGITNEFLKKNGSLIIDVLDQLLSYIKYYNVSYFVSHNVLFDSYIMMNSALRRGWSNDSLLLLLENKMEYFCTCQQIDSITGKSKFLSLNDSVRKILKEEPSELCNALTNMMYCKRIFFKLREKNCETTYKLHKYKQLKHHYFVVKDNDEEMEEKTCVTPSFQRELTIEKKFGSEIYSMYYDECGDPFDSFNLANWDGDQQVGFRD
tara:strand:- start:6641 stop:7636 length:996 start_codon:yes stop_codon:yes gene_type:complete